MRLAVLVVAAALLGAATLAPTAHAKIPGASDRAFEYLERQSTTAGPLAANIAEAAAAAGKDPAAWPEGDPVAARITVPGPGASNISLLRPLRALALAHDPRASMDGELTQRVAAHVGETGFGDPVTLNDDAYAILALAAAGPLDDNERFATMRARLLENQHTTGGWGWAVGGGPETDMTGMVIEALIASGGLTDEARAGAAAFLATTRDASTGGYAESPGDPPNCESTVWGIRASSRLGLPPSADDWDFLLGLQRDDGGFAHVAGGPSDLFSTTEAAGLLGEVMTGSVTSPEPVDEIGVPSVGFPAVALGLFLLAVVARTTRLRQP